MNCTNHLDRESAVSCQACGRAFCGDCVTLVSGSHYCHQCRSDPRYAYLTSGPKGLSPGAVFGLGLIPGVGAICNGDYLKAFVHVMVFGFLVSISNMPGTGMFEPLFTMLAIAFYFYMPLEAYHTARRRLLESQGLLVAAPRSSRADSLWAGLILTAIGIVLFVDKLAPGFMEHVLKLWPILLIAFGAARIMGHLKKARVGEVRQ